MQYLGHLHWRKFLYKVKTKSKIQWKLQARLQEHLKYFFLNAKYILLLINLIRAESTNSTYHEINIIFREH